MDILIILFFGLASSFIGLCDNVIFSDARKKKLNETFDTWYRIVAKQDKIKVALLFCKKVNDILDSVFGLRHLSKRLFLKSFFISSGMLLVTIGLLSFANKQPFWTTPWKEYTDSVNFILNTTDDLDSLAHYSQFTEIEYQKSDSSSSTNFYILNYNTNYYILRYNTNGIYSSQRIEPLGHGHLVVDYGRIFYAGSTNQTTNGVGKIETAKDLMDKMAVSYTHLDVYKRQDSTFANGSAGEGGGATYSTLNRCHLFNNSSGDGGGGANSCTLNNCFLTGNTAFESGGGGYYCTINNSVLTNNYSNAGGGAGFCTVNNSLLTGNSANWGGAAAGGTLNNCTMTGNSAIGYGGGGSDCVMNNCIVYYLSLIHI